MNFIQAGLTMIVGVAMFAIVFFVISEPLDLILDGFDNMEGDTSDEMDLYLPSIRSAMKIAFALIIISPVVGFMVWVYSRNPEWTYYRRY